MSNNMRKLDTCMCCDSPDLKLILDLNTQPLANSYKKSKEETQEEYPLAMNVCEHCHHLQLTHAVNPDLMFKNYLYVSGTSQTLRDYFDWFVGFTREYFNHDPHSVLDVACNDGSQLNSFKAAGFSTYGIDPASNLHEISSASHTVICDYLKPVHANVFPKMDIVIAQNVLAHNANPQEFVKTISNIMHDGSLFFAQTSQADMIRNNEFDTIYHEHQSFFQIHSMNALAKSAGLNLIDVVRTPVHGNSFVFVLSKARKQPARLKNLLDMEKAAGLTNLDTYITYGKQASKLVNHLNDTVRDMRREGRIIVGYGAAAKGMTLLNFSQIKPDFIIDDNPLKQGLFCPGNNVPIVDIMYLGQYANQKVCFIPLAWNFYDEIVTRIKKVRDNPDDKFVRYFPEITIT